MSDYKFPGAKLFSDIVYSGEFGDAKLYRYSAPTVGGGLRVCEGFVDITEWDGESPVVKEWGKGVKLNKPELPNQCHKPIPCVECSNYGDFAKTCSLGLFKVGLKSTAPTSAFSQQVGGSHYTELGIQPFEYSMANKLDPMRHTIIKYVTRNKGGLEDLRKARHTLDLLIEWEEKHATQKG